MGRSVGQLIGGLVGGWTDGLSICQSLDLSVC